MSFWLHGRVDTAISSGLSRLLEAVARAWDEGFCGERSGRLWGGSIWLGLVLFPAHIRNRWTHVIGPQSRGRGVILPGAHGLRAPAVLRGLWGFSHRRLLGEAEGGSSLLG